MASTKEDYEKRKHKIFEFLGGKCVECGSVHDLQIDHTNHLDKNFTISSSWGISWDRLLPELLKCQLLCKKCHLDKTLAEGSLAKGWTNQPRQQHGTVWSYTKYKCRCAECKLAKSIAMKKQYLCLAQSG